MDKTNNKFYLMTATGLTPPKFKHDTIESATTEAKRLAQVTNSKVEILEIVGEVRMIHVPAHYEPKIEIFDKYPF